MSNQGDEPPPGPPPRHPDHTFQSNNPWASEQSAAEPQHTAPPSSDYVPPSGPPPGHPAMRRGTFQESDFVPESQLGEQRETMQQFEMNRSQPESETDRNVATLQQEFPSVDGSLIAAIYGDSQSLSATREMLREIAGTAQGPG